MLYKVYVINKYLEQTIYCKLTMAAEAATVIIIAITV